MELFEDDPISRPLTYPGRIPPHPGVLVDRAYVPLRAEGEWQAGDEPLAGLLARLDCPPMSARHKVVAVGSNAAPSQVLRKFRDHGVRPVVPMTTADVPGIAPGVSAHVSRWGYVPAAPIDTPGETSRLFVLWLDELQLAALDLTEPNYHRRTLALNGSSAFVYTGRHGCLTDARGRPRRLTSQRTLIQDLLDESPHLRRLCGNTPDDFIAGVRDDTVREAVCRLFRTERRVGGGAQG
ncbi:hypothetical protein [Nonomuraea jiangxiensis]|uniref:Uncharacterized protein n=1 Tax=Nonomuraea jiangxiensis TaxID=633440 RepID=A0A1G9FMN9_9ACTN|nr:hypothetical protein [Nonomuraea jiangxiensis]SDK89637.1 hypothetical protein SAMN05421869_12010 [Nonomuraea jiangxiensis]